MGAILVLHSVKDSTMYFIRTFGLVGVDVFQEISNTVNMDTDVIHLWMRAWAFIWYRGICNWCELFVKLSVKDVGFRVCVISQETIFPQGRN